MKMLKMQYNKIESLTMRIHRCRKEKINWLKGHRKVICFYFIRFFINFSNL